MLEARRNESHPDTEPIPANLCGNTAPTRANAAAGGSNLEEFCEIFIGANVKK